MKHSGTREGRRCKIVESILPSYARTMAHHLIQSIEDVLKLTPLKPMIQTNSSRTHPPLTHPTSHNHLIPISSHDVVPPNVHNRIHAGHIDTSSTLPDDHLAHY